MKLSPHRCQLELLPHGTWHKGHKPEADLNPPCSCFFSCQGLQGRSADPDARTVFIACALPSWRGESLGCGKCRGVAGVACSLIRLFSNDLVHMHWAAWQPQCEADNRSHLFSTDEGTTRALPCGAAPRGFWVSGATLPPGQGCAEEQESFGRSLQKEHLLL